MTDQRRVGSLAQQLGVTVATTFDQRGPENHTEWCCTYHLTQNNSNLPIVVPGREWYRRKYDAKEQTARDVVVLLQSWDGRGLSARCFVLQALAHPLTGPRPQL
jgi:hypothetical protein